MASLNRKHQDFQCGHTNVDLRYYMYLFYLCRQANWVDSLIWKRGEIIDTVFIIRRRLCIFFPLPILIFLDFFSHFLAPSMYTTVTECYLTASNMLCSCEKGNFTILHYFEPIVCRSILAHMMAKTVTKEARNMRLDGILLSFN